MKRIFLIILALILSSCGTGGVLDTSDATSTEITDGATGVSASGSYSFTFPKAVRPETVTIDSFYIASVAGASASATKIPFTLSLSKGEHSVVSVHGSTGSPRTDTFLGSPRTDNPEKGTVPFFKSFNPTVCTTSNRIPGTVNGSSDNKTFTYTTTNPLQGHTPCAICITDDVIYADGVPYIGSTITFTTGLAVNSISPTRGATGVAFGATVSATFSAAVKTETVTTSNFKVSTASNDIGGTIALDTDRKVATFTPSSNLAADTSYSVTLTSTIQSDSNEALSTYTSTFSTALDTTAPEFSGVTSAISDSTSAITLGWSAAEDDVNSASQIAYLIFMADESEGEDYSAPAYRTSAGATSYQVTGLSALTTYYFVVRAVDTAGNIDTNHTEISGTTRGTDLPNALLMGLSFSCVTTEGGELYCWGVNSSGQLGVGDAADKYSPVLSGSGTVWSSVSTSTFASHACGIVSGVAYCWGDNDYGQVGDNTVIDKSSPTALDTTYTSNTNWSSISVGYQYTCGIKTDGKAYCWGYNQTGQLGVNSENQQEESPNALSNAGAVENTEWSSISTGVTHTCGMKTDGTAYCWGCNAQGQVGNNGTGEPIPPEKSPVALTDPANWASINVILSGSQAHGSTCGVKTDGSAYCWGYNGDGQVGDGTSGDGTNRMIPTALNITPNTNWTSLSQGTDLVCGLKTDGAVYCWGSNTSGKLGDGSATNRSSPTSLSITNTPNLNWSSIELEKVVGLGTDVHTCATKTDGTTYCWGTNNYGELGIGTLIAKYAPTRIGTTTDWETVYSQATRSCGIKTNGQIFCWGAYNYGQLGIGEDVEANVKSPRQVGADLGW